MSQFGWGLISNIIKDREDIPPAYRWDLEGSQYYELRPDRWLPEFYDAYRLLTPHGLLERHEALRGHSRGGGGPSALTQPPPSSRNSPQARAAAQGGKSGAPARASTRGSRPGRKSCPKGHYWSYKHGKCMKSKYR